MKAELIFLLEKFSQSREQIQSLFEHDQEFQALCLDYFLCVRALNNLEFSIRKLQDRLQEHVELERVLESGMLAYINQEKPTGNDLPGSGAITEQSGSKVG